MFSRLERLSVSLPGVADRPVRGYYVQPKAWESEASEVSQKNGISVGPVPIGTKTVLFFPTFSNLCFGLVGSPQEMALAFVRACRNDLEEEVGHIMRDCFGLAAPYALQFLQPFAIAIVDKRDAAFGQGEDKPATQKSDPGKDPSPVFDIGKILSRIPGEPVAVESEEDIYASGFPAERMLRTASVGQEQWDNFLVGISNLWLEPEPGRHVKGRVSLPEHWSQHAAEIQGPLSIITMPGARYVETPPDGTWALLVFPQFAGEGNMVTPDRHQDFTEMFTKKFAGELRKKMTLAFGKDQSNFTWVFIYPFALAIVNTRQAKPGAEEKFDINEVLSRIPNEPVAVEPEGDIYARATGWYKDALGRPQHNKPRPPAPHEINSASGAYFYAHSILHAPFPQGEDAIAQEPAYSLDYALNVLHGPFPKGEEELALDAPRAVEYAAQALHGRFEKAEPYISEDQDASIDYAKDVIKGRFLEGEPAIASYPESAYTYAQDVIKGAWPEGEDAIAKDSELSYLYADEVIHRRFPKGEAGILANSKYVNEYRKKYVPPTIQEVLKQIPREEIQAEPDEDIYASSWASWYKIADLLNKKYLPVSPGKSEKDMWVQCSMCKKWEMTDPNPVYDPSAPTIESSFEHVWKSPDQMTLQERADVARIVQAINEGVDISVSHAYCPQCLIQMAKASNIPVERLLASLRGMREQSRQTA
jgi:hypothetical protein